jgi:sugar/nucleoside kinase (ribokinase family)
MSILCTGSVAYDYLMNFPGYFKDHIIPEKLEHISLSFLVDSMVKQRGGVAPNIAYTLALLGEKPRLMATVGEDFDEYRTWLETHGIDTRCVRSFPENTQRLFLPIQINPTRKSPVSMRARWQTRQTLKSRMPEKTSLWW